MTYGEWVSKHRHNERPYTPNPMFSSVVSRIDAEEARKKDIQGKIEAHFKAGLPIGLVADKMGMTVSEVREFWRPRLVT